MKVIIIGQYPYKLDQNFTGPMRVVYNLHTNLVDRISFEIPTKRTRNPFTIILQMIFSRAIIFNLHGVGILTFIGYFIAKLKFRKIIYTAHGVAALESRIGYDYPKYYLWIEKKIVKGSNKIVTVSKLLKKMILKEYTIHKNKIKVIPNGVDDTFFLKPKVLSFRKKFSLSANDKLILFAGGSRKVKGLVYLIEILSNIECRYKLVIVGNISNSNIRKNDHFNMLTKRNKIKLVGNINNSLLIEAYHESQFIIHPSLYEPFGLVPLEAMACGKTVVVSDRVGMCYIITHGKDGFIFQHKNKKKLKSLITHLIMNPKLCEKIGKNAKMTASKYKWDKSSELYYQLFRSMK